MNFSLIDNRLYNINNKKILKINNKEILFKEMEHTNKLLEDSHKYVYNFCLLIYSAIGILIWKLFMEQTDLLNEVSLFSFYSFLIIILILILFFFSYEREKRKKLIKRKELILKRLNNIV
ncbi:hypothetical protein [Halarcobacter sp.]|uniref:hypothetical protein n=1 Tax=Halarcobacter sp. TaxID=2321133 RepID=UPI003B0012B6